MGCLIFPVKCSISCSASDYNILTVNLKVQLYCIVTGSCCPFLRSSHLMYTYTRLGGELFVSVTFITFLCLSLLHLHSKQLQSSTYVGKPSAVAVTCLANSPALIYWTATERNGDLQRLICVLVVRPSRCPTLSNKYVGKPSAVGQPTRPTQPFILSG